MFHNDIIHMDNPAPIHATLLVRTPTSARRHHQAWHDHLSTLRTFVSLARRHEQGHHYILLGCGSHGSVSDHHPHPIGIPSAVARFAIACVSHSLFLFSHCCSTMYDSTEVRWIKLRKLCAQYLIRAIDRVSKLYIISHFLLDWTGFRFFIASPSCVTVLCILYYSTFDDMN
ncbi:hypothetical protein CCHR01_07657 [Colletotrichum chrysophilum]|uniref:Uncharacterized protein n=1 Tax=Colletotrichum chrysophilum TaxID=1836956 RepID=A0AAD9EIK2_9PEZI|nr:hypothetical protein CCHR01_07657 [Colletotrichum chrysophilum]